MELIKTISIEDNLLGTVEIDTSKWSAEAWAYYAARGVKENVTNASAGKSGDEARKARRAKADEAIAGKIPSRGGFAKRDALAVELEAIVSGFLREMGKSAKWTKATIKEHGAAMAFRTYIAPSFGDNAEATWERAVANAEAIVSMRKLPDIEVEVSTD